MKIDICIPTWNSEGVLEDSLQALNRAEQASEVSIACVRFADNLSSDNTEDIARRGRSKFEWEIEWNSVNAGLPTARASLIRRVDTDWFLFLDDDVRVSEDYLSHLAASTAPAIGAIQGRKRSRASPNTGNASSTVPGSPTDWVRERAFRGGTHATLVRTEAAASIEYPPDLVVWEDEYLRREIERSGYLWIFNHQAIFEHDDQGRHGPTWEAGYLQGKYGLRPAWHVLLKVPYALLAGRSVADNVKMVLGYGYARIRTQSQERQ